MIGFRARLERIRESLFFVPTLYVAWAIALAEATLTIDRNGVDVPVELLASVESARSLLSTIAGATITVAGIAFSVSLLVIQLASSQYSPRVLRNFFRDPFQKRTMGIVVGVFTYCLVVLRAVRRPAEEGAEAVIPHISVLVSVILGIAAILAIVAFINHSAHSMQVGVIIRRITEETRAQIARLFPLPERDRLPAGPVDAPDAHGTQISSGADGWIQQIDRDALLELVPPGGTVRLDTRTGVFVTEGTPLCTLWPPPGDLDQTTGRVRRAFGLGSSRTMQEDVAFGIDQIVDIALRALSPGVNDPTTARECIVHLGAILRDLLTRDLPPRRTHGEEGRMMLFPHVLEHHDYVDLAFDQIRQTAADIPAIAITLLQILGLLVETLSKKDLPGRTAALRRQAAMVVEAAQRNVTTAYDLERIQRTAKSYDLM